MRYRLYLGLIEEELNEIFGEICSDSDGCEFSLFSVDIRSLDDSDKYFLDVMLAYMFYTYVILRVIRGYDIFEFNEEFDQEDRDLIVDHYIEYLSRCKGFHVLDNYLESTDEDIGELADAIYDGIEDLFLDNQVIDSVAYSMAVNILQEELELSHLMFVITSPKIYFDIGVNSSLLARGAVEIEYD